MSAKDGGPAFPTDGLSVIEGHVYQAVKSSGMTLRDYFAAAAMQGLIGRTQSFYTDDEFERWAKRAYRVADVMVAERDRK